MAEIVLLTEEEVAERLRCSVARIGKLRSEGELPYLIGPPVLIPEADLNEYIRATLVRPTRTAQLPESQITTASMTELDRRYEEVHAIIGEIIEKSGGRLRMTPSITKMLESIKDHPKSIASARQVAVARIRMEQRALGLKINGEPYKKNLQTKQAAAQTKKRVKAAYKQKLAKQAADAAAAGVPPITKSAEAARRRRLAEKRKASAELHHANKSPPKSS